MRSNGTSGAKGTGVLAVGVIAGTLVLGVAACGSSSSGQPAASGASASSTHAMHHGETMSHAFGSDCGMIPASGMGSLHGMSMDPVVTAASHNPLLSMFAADIKTAGLGAELNSMHAVTIFAPANTAFHKLSGHQMGMMHSNTELAKILKYHVVDGRITPSKLASGMTLTTLEGGTLKPAKMGAVYEVNKAQVICGNIQTSNATVYIINSVLTPMH